jgi:hypothetical protein
MCLTTIDEQNDSPSNMIMSGWKEFSTRGASNLEFQNNALRGNNQVPLDQWIVAEKQLIKATDGKKYNTGFHVWIDETKESKKLTHVYIRKISTIGTQDTKRVAIAEEMYVPSNPNDWPPKPGEPSKKETMLDKAKKMVKGGTA